MYLVEFRIQGLGLRVVFIGCAGRYVFWHTGVYNGLYGV